MYQGADRIRPKAVYACRGREAWHGGKRHQLGVSVGDGRRRCEYAKVGRCGMGLWRSNTQVTHGDGHDDPLVRLECVWWRREGVARILSERRQARGTRQPGKSWKGPKRCYKQEVSGGGQRSLMAGRQGRSGERACLSVF